MPLPVAQVFYFKRVADSLSATFELLGLRKRFLKLVVPAQIFLQNLA